MKTEDFDKIKKGDKVTWKSFSMDAPGGYITYTGIAEKYFPGDAENSDGWMCRAGRTGFFVPMTRSMVHMNGVEIER